MRAVLDTNVLISSVITDGTCHELLVRGFRGDFAILASRETIDECKLTLLKYPDRFGLDEDEVKREVQTVSYFAEFVDPTVEIDAIEADPSDNMFLEIAVASEADYIVSGDNHLLDLEVFDGIPIVTPDQFLKTLG